MSRRDMSLGVVYNGWGRLSHITAQSHRKMQLHAFWNCCGYVKLRYKGSIGDWTGIRNSHLNAVPWFEQQSEQPTCFFQEDLGHRRTPWYVSRPGACHLRVAALPRPSLQWQTPALQNAGNFHLVPEPTVEKSEQERERGEKKKKEAISQACDAKKLPPENKMRTRWRLEATWFSLTPSVFTYFSTNWKECGGSGGAASLLQIYWKWQISQDRRFVDFSVTDCW